MKTKFYSKIKNAGLMGLLGLVGLMGYSSCSDFLEIEPLNEITLEKFWTEKADVEGIIAGCYSGLQDQNIIRRMIVWGECRSENVGIGMNINDDTQLEKVMKENIDAKNGYTVWDGFYNIINRCNTVIKYAPGVAASDPAYAESELNAHIAEVTALRSLCYFYLIRTFRDVPYSTVAFTDDDQKMDLPATKFEDVLDSLITSLEGVKNMAVKRYPTTTPLYQTGRITQDAIHAMLCEMYLWKQDYQNCIKYANLVIDSKKQIAEENKRSSNSYGFSGNTDENRFNGYPLVNGSITSGYFGNAYTTLFGRDDNAQNYNQEIIFQLVFDDDPRGHSMITNGAVNAFYGNATTPMGMLVPSDYVLEDIEKSSQRTIFADRNKKVDARMYESCNGLFGTVNKYVTNSVIINAQSSSDISTTYSGIYTEGQNASNWVIYRLSDIMLLKAEALSQLLSPDADQAAIDYNKPMIDEAFALVNAVNKRSVCETQLVDTLSRNDYTTKARLETLVYQERQRELMFEGKRWYDLVRIARREGNTQTLVNAALRKVTTGSALIANKLAKMDAIYWPYNYEELKVNRNLHQNSAFSSGDNGSYATNN